MGAPRVVLADDDVLLREGLASLLDRSGFEVVGQAGNSTELLVRARLGVNFTQIPVNAPIAPVHTYSKDGIGRVHNVTDPVYFPNSKGGPQADSEHNQPPSWYADGELVRTAYELHAEDDDWGQAGTLVREVMDDAARDRLVSNIVGALLAGVTEPVLQRAFWYLSNVDENLGERVEKGVRDGQR